MACPYFLPEGKLETGPWTHRPRLPLGDAFRGVCLAQPEAPHTPPPPHQEQLCNCGYSVGRCERFPDESVADAVRFSVTKDTRSRLQVMYILEKDHAPKDFGRLEFSIADRGFLDPPSNAILAAQAQAFVESYLAHTRAVRAAGQ